MCGWGKERGFAYQEDRDFRCVFFILRDIHGVSSLIYLVKSIGFRKFGSGMEPPELPDDVSRIFHLKAQ